MTKQNKTNKPKDNRIWLYNTDVSEQDIKDYKEAYDYREDDITDEEAIEFELMVRIDELKTYIENVDKTANMFVVLGSCGTWRGRFFGGRVYKSLTDVYELFEDYTYVYHKDKKSTLSIKAIHHDGTNYYDVFAVAQGVTEEQIDELMWVHSQNDKERFQRLKKRFLRNIKYKPEYWEEL